MVAVDEGHKFAVLALPRLHAAGRRPRSLVLGPGVAFSNAPPAHDAAQWESGLGPGVYESFREAGSYLIVSAASARPEVLDEENEDLKRRVLGFHTGLLLACPFIAHDEAIFVEGAQRKGFTEYRGRSTYAGPIRYGDALKPVLEEPQLRRALALWDTSQRLRATKSGGRFGRVLSAYRRGVNESAIDVRLHQFVRATEGFVGSFRKEEFAERVAEMIDGIDVVSLRQMYDLRSKVEHLADWQGALSVKGRDAKRAALLERAAQAQLIAQHLVERFLSAEHVWPHYVDSASLGAYRASSTIVSRRADWATTLDVNSTLAHVLYPALLAELRREGSG